jgi:site-specific recombinase XerD
MAGNQPIRAVRDAEFRPDRESATLGIVRDLARFLVNERAKADWSTVQTSDVEAFLNAAPANRRKRLTGARQFFGWTRRNKVVLIDPTTAINLTPQRGFNGDTLTLAEQRRLFRRWTTTEAFSSRSVRIWNSSSEPRASSHSRSRRP